MDTEEGSASRSMMEKLLGAMTPWQRRKFLQKFERRFERKVRQAEFRAYEPPKGYCCPRCHEWKATPTERLACRLGHIAQLDLGVTA